MLSRKAFKHHAHLQSLLPKISHLSREASSYSCRQHLDSHTFETSTIPLHLLSYPAPFISHQNVNWHSNIQNTRILGKSDDSKPPPDDQPKTPPKPRRERKKEIPTPDKDNSSKKSTVRPKNSNSGSSLTPPSTPPPPSAPPTPPRPNHADKLYQYASAAAKQQIMILPINKRPLIPGMIVRAHSVSLR